MNVDQTSETVHYYAGFPGKPICGGETSLAVAPITTIRQDHVTCERCKELFGIYSSPAPVTSKQSFDANRKARWDQARAAYERWHATGDVESKQAQTWMAGYVSSLTDAISAVETSEPPVFRSGRVCNCREYPRWAEECSKCLFERPAVEPTAYLCPNCANAGCTDCQPATRNLGPEAPQLHPLFGTLVEILTPALTPQRANCDVCDKRPGTHTRTVTGIETWVCDACETPWLWPMCNRCGMEKSACECSSESESEL